MKHRTIVVTGSSSGIGRAITETLLKAGAEVVGLARNHEKFTPEVSHYKYYKVDISDLENLPKTFLKILKNHPKVDGFVSNAGYGDFKSLENFSPTQIISYLNTNLTSHIIMTRLLLPFMKKQKSGKIIFIGSEAAIRGAQKGSIYNAAKFGLRGFSQSIREESSNSNIHVSIVNPGMVRTQFFEKLNFGPGEDKTNAIEPSDIAEVIVNILNMRHGTVIDEINLSPLKKVIKFD
jgi:3-hydroxy acid dehydrogenase/malonic semialdehyde reductase